MRVTLIGGTGFLGRRIANALLARGFQLRIAVRGKTARAPAISPGSVEYFHADVQDGASIRDALEGANCVINAVGHYRETSDASFDDIHVKGAALVAQEAVRAQVGRLFHISGIGADALSPSRYVRSRRAGEDAVREIFPAAVILRPSVLFSEQGSFLDPLIGLVKHAPLVPLFGDGRTRLQPVHADDVAEALAALVSNPQSRHLLFELGGPEIVTYRELLLRIGAHLDRRPLLLPLPFPLWHLLAAGCAILPRPPITRDQIILMSRDNLAAEGIPGLRELGISPTALDDTLRKRIARS